MKGLDVAQATTGPRRPRTAPGPESEWKCARRATGGGMSDRGGSGATVCRTTRPFGRRTRCSSDSVFGVSTKKRIFIAVTQLKCWSGNGSASAAPARTSSRPARTAASLRDSVSATISALWSTAVIRQPLASARAAKVPPPQPISRRWSSAARRNSASVTRKIAWWGFISRHISRASGPRGLRSRRSVNRSNNANVISCRDRGGTVQPRGPGRTGISPKMLRRAIGRASTLCGYPGAVADAPSRRAR